MEFADFGLQLQFVRMISKLKSDEIEMIFLLKDNHQTEPTTANNKKTYSWTIIDYICKNVTQSKIPIYLKTNTTRGTRDVGQYTRWVTHSPTMRKTLRTPSVIYVENVHFDWFNEYLHTREHFQSDLNIFQFDIMFVKPHDVPPLHCLN